MNLSDKLPKETIQNLFDHLLDQYKINDIKNKEMNEEPEIFNHSISFQNGIIDKYIQVYFLDVASEIIKEFFHHNLWNYIFIKI